jgi:hypothetical protein
MNIRASVTPPPARRIIEDAIERLLAMLDEMEPDPDYEPENDDEPSLGWPEDRPGSGEGRRLAATACPDECEVEDEHGGDIQDEPHDDIGEAEQEHDEETVIWSNDPETPQFGSDWHGCPPGPNC